MQVQDAGVPRGVSEPRPRLVQTAFTAILAVDVLLRISDGRLSPISWPGLAVVLAVVLNLVVVRLDPSAHPDGAVAAVVSVAGIALVGLAGLGDPSNGTTVLVVIPSLWLGLRHGVPGALAAMGATALLVVLGPALLGHVEEPHELVSVVLVAGAAAVAARSMTTAVLRAQNRSGEGAATLGAVLDTVDVGLAVLDLDGRMVAQNHHHQGNIDRAHPEGFPGVLDVPQHGFAEDGHTPLTHDDRPTVLTQRGHELDDYRIWVGQDPETRVALSVSSRSVRDGSGRRIGAVVATRDITVFMRSLHARDEIISRASHDLRTPLSSIFGYLHLLGAHDDLSDAAREDLESVLQSTERLARQVADLVDAARRDQGRIPLTRHEVGLVPFLTGVVDTLRPRTHDAGVRLELHAQGEGDALVDPERVTELMGLLVDDAVGRCPQGGVVHVGIDAADGVGEISVVDDGSRPPTDGRLLERCREIAEAHGGRLETEEVARGAVVRVRLRLAAPQEQPG